MTDKIPHVDVCICNVSASGSSTQTTSRAWAMRTRDEFSYSIIVADNDRDECRGRWSSRLPPAFRAGVISVIASNPCKILPSFEIAFCSTATGDFVALIDDDELPSQGLAHALFSTCEKTQADGILGPVLPDFPDDVPNLVQAISAPIDFRKAILTGATAMERIPHWKRIDPPGGRSEATRTVLAQSLGQAARIRIFSVGRSSKDAYFVVRRGGSS